MKKQFTYISMTSLVNKRKICLPDITSKENRRQSSQPKGPGVSSDVGHLTADYTRAHTQALAPLEITAAASSAQLLVLKTKT